MSWNYDTEIVGVDTETLGVRKDDQPFAVSLHDDSGENILFEWDVDPFTREVKVNRKDIKRIKSLCRGKTLIFHNRNFDIQKLELIGCNLSWRNNSYDTQNLSHIIDSETHSKVKGRLKELSLFYLDIPDDDQKDLRQAVSKARRIAIKLGWKVAEKKKSSKKSDDHLFQDYWLPKAIAIHEKYDASHPWHTILAKYANTDTERTVLLYLLFMSIISKWPVDDKRHGLIQRETKLGNALYDMYCEGIPLFPRKIKSEIKRYKSKIDPAIATMQKLTRLPEFNIESPLQLQKYLFKTLKFPVLKTTATGNPSTDKNVRKDLREWMEVQRKVSPLNTRRIRFLDAWDDYKESISSESYLLQYDAQRDGNFLHSSLDQNGTSTTRMSCRTHNVKKGEEKDGKVLKEGLRNVFGPKKGRCWFCLDYSQLQLRIFAHVTEERSMIEAFEAGYDFHGFIASKIFGVDLDKVTKMQRRIGKNVNFGFIFGASPKKIESTAGVSGLWDTVCKMFPSAHSYMQSVKMQIRHHGYVTTPHGYRLYCDAAHKGVNYIVQGCEGDLMKEGMVLCEEYLSYQQADGFSGKMIFQIHDELVFDFPFCLYSNRKWNNRSIVKDIKKLMEQPGKDIGMVTPVDVEWTTTDWSQVKEYNLAT